MDPRRALRRLAVVVALAVVGLATTAVSNPSPANAAPPIPGGAIYQIFTVGLGVDWCLTGGGFIQGRVTRIEPCAEAVNSIHRRWIPHNLDGDSLYEVRMWSIGHCLAIGGARTDAGAKAIQWTCLGSAEQRWRFTPNGDGHSLVNVNSGLCLNWQAFIAGDAHQWPCNGSHQQRWYFRPL